MKENAILSLLLLLIANIACSQSEDNSAVYKKRVLESVEIDLLGSYYTQDGNNAAVSGGIGTEYLKDLASAIVVSIPLNDDDILKIDGTISAYSSASSSNIDPFDGKEAADPYIQSTGASTSDSWYNVTINYSHSSDDRNNVYSAKASLSSEYDYFSIGIGGGFTKLFNKKNTDLDFNFSIYEDSWNAIYPRELRAFGAEGYGLNDGIFSLGITGNPNYNPNFKEHSNERRSSYSLGFSFSQILSNKLQTSLLLDLVMQRGLLSTPFQRVYFSDVIDSYIENFLLADDIEQLPATRIKIVMGGRLNYYVNEFLVVRSYYRYYIDDWDIASHTVSLELPVKFAGNFTVYPSYRFYMQTNSKYFAKYNEHLSTDKYYTSDYDLSAFNANQYGIGLSYTDAFTKVNIWRLGLKNIDIRVSHYERNTGLQSQLYSGALKFVIE